MKDGAEEADKGGGSEVEKDMGCGVKVDAVRPFVFDRRKVGAARRPTVVKGAGGIACAGAFGMLALLEEAEVEEPVNITFLPPQPMSKKSKEKKN